MNTIDKMRRSQQKTREHLEKQGYKVWFIQHTRYQKDMWGLFDGIALKSNIAYPYLIQVKSNSFPTLKPFKEFKQKFPFVHLLLVNVKDRKGVFIKQI